MRLGKWKSWGKVLTIKYCFKFIHEYQVLFWYNSLIRVSQLLENVSRCLIIGIGLSIQATGLSTHHKQYFCILSVLVTELHSYVYTGHCSQACLCMCYNHVCQQKHWGKNNKVISIVKSSQKRLLKSNFQYTRVTQRQVSHLMYKLFARTAFYFPACSSSSWWQIVDSFFSISTVCQLLARVI